MDSYDSAADLGFNDNLAGALQGRLAKAYVPGRAGYWSFLHAPSNYPDSRPGLYAFPQIFSRS